MAGKNKLIHISDDIVSKAIALSQQHPELVPMHQMLQKLTILDFVVPLLNPKKDQTILEIGAGLGIHSALLSHYGRVWSTELQIPGSFVGAGQHVARSREDVFEKLGEGPIDFRYHDGHSFPYESESFDVVFHNSVIEHVSDIDRFNREAYRILKPGGLCICITGTPALCWFRLTKHYAFRLPVLLALLAAREVMGPLVGKSVSRLRRIDQRLDALHPAIAAEPGADNLNVRALHARLFHYIHFPDYNRVVFTKAAADSGVSESQLLYRVRDYFKRAKKPDRIRDRAAHAWAALPGCLARNAGMAARSLGRVFPVSRLRGREDHRIPIPSRARGHAVAEPERIALFPVGETHSSLDRTWVKSRPRIRDHYRRPKGGRSAGLNRIPAPKPGLGGGNLRVRQTFSY